MKIAWFTNFKGIESTNVGMIAALEELGHTVYLVNSFDYSRNFYREQALQDYVAVANKSDVCIVTKGTWIPKHRFRWLASEIPLTMFTPDSISVGPPGRTEEVGERAHRCKEVILTGYEGAKWLRETGYKGRVAQIYQGHRPHVWEQKKVKTPVAHQCSFLGSFYRNDGNRKAKLQKLHEAGVTVYRSKRVFLEEASQLYYNTPINYNFNCGDLTSNRVLRILASEGFCLTQTNKDIEHSFINKKHLVWWNEPPDNRINAEELIALTREWLGKTKEREEIAAFGHELAKKFTWVKQMAKHVRFLQGEDVPPDGAAADYVGSYKNSS